ncbi:MAG: tRNA (adenosine(37)-N6)-threonylcarbamoyltransferase complex ATPase subunit type 1 TsaE [Lachnospiraceae bacterium]|nr:tRNA (adenosine(37)-N6)-threonylcarbamoyltransferase complex ATPase subunit type 1 TsaE [Lachnospiraceae bacterium]
MVIETTTREETLALGVKIGKQALPGTVICVDGDLGAGKTVLAQGIAKGLGVMEQVVSPTFTIIQEYRDGRLPFYHFDVYRIEDPDEMYEVGFEDYFYGDGVCMIEWAELIRELLPEEHVHITIEKQTDRGSDYRRIRAEGMPE